MLQMSLSRQLDPANAGARWIDDEEIAKCHRTVAFAEVMVARSS